MTTINKSHHFNCVEEITAITMPKYNIIPDEERNNILELLNGYGYLIYDLAKETADVAEMEKEIFDTIADSAENSWMTVVAYGTGIWACELLSIFVEIFKDESDQLVEDRNKVWGCGFCGKEVARNVWNPLRLHMMKGECIISCFN